MSNEEKERKELRKVDPLSLICTHCETFAVEYVAPGNWCKYCWTAWWVAGCHPKNEKEYLILFKESLALIPEDPAERVQEGNFWKEIYLMIKNKLS